MLNFKNIKLLCFDTTAQKQMLSNILFAFAIDADKKGRKND